MNALQTSLRTSRRLPAQLGRRWASQESSIGSSAEPEAGMKPDSAGPERTRTHKKWKTVVAAESNAEKQVVSTTQSQAASRPSATSLQHPKRTSVHKLKRMLDPSAPFFSGGLPLSPPTISLAPSNLSRSSAVEFLRSDQMTKHLKETPNARRVASLSPSELARNVLTRNQAMSNKAITESLRTIRKLAESKNPGASV